MAHAKYPAVPFKPLGVGPLPDVLPSQLGRGESLLRHGIRYHLAPGRIRKLGKAREFLTAPLADGIGELVTKIAEECEGLVGCPFLPHE